MPIETVVVLAIIVCAFAIFAGAVAWGERSSSPHAVNAGVTKPSIGKSTLTAAVPKVAPAGAKTVDVKAAA